MKKASFLFLFVLLLGFFLTKVNLFDFFSQAPKQQPLSNDSPSETDSFDPTFPSVETDQKTEEKNLRWQAPLDRAKERVNKKPFGIFITPQNSPVKPERFSGYHTGVDFEILDEELESPVFVRAICQGKLLLKQRVNGYGGVAVQSCHLDDQPLTVIYGHLQLSSIEKQIGENLKPGDVLGQLGKNQSAETDGERKHLHLGLHQGESITFLGYVSTEKELENWLDPCKYVCP